MTARIAALLTVVLCAICLLAFGAADSHAAGRYVAFGDSSTTGSGLGTQYPGSRELCWQTQNSYPVFVASALSFNDFASAACSAAWVNDLTTTQNLGSEVNPVDVAPAQLDTLNGTETLVTMSIGINDSGYGDIVNDCLNDTTAATPCQDSSQFHNFVTRTNTYLNNSLGDAIDEVHRRSPQAEVWVVGYPRLVPQDVSNCPGKIDIYGGDAPVINAWQNAVNDAEKAITESRDAYYVDVFSASTGHDACQTDPDVRWQNPGPSATPSGWSHHPTLAGHTAVAGMFVSAFNSPRPIRPVRVGNGINGTTPIGQTLSIKFDSKRVRAVTAKLAPITSTAPSNHGAKLNVTLTRTGTVEFFIDRAKPGHVKNGRCRSLSRRASKGRKACTRYVSLPSSVALSLPGGGSNVYFTGRAAGKRLPAGRYRLRAALGALSAKTRTFTLSR